MMKKFRGYPYIHHDNDIKGGKQESRGGGKRTWLAAIIRSSDERQNFQMDSASLRFFKVGCFQVAF